MIEKEVRKIELPQSIGEGPYYDPKKPSKLKNFRKGRNFINRRKR